MDRAFRADLPVTIFLPSLAGGGAERCGVAVANGLARRGADVTLALGTTAGPYLGEVRPDVGVVDLHASSVPRALPGLVRHLRSSRPAVLLSAMNHANVVATVAHRLAGCRGRLVLSERVHFSSLLNEFRGLRMFALCALMRLTYPRADRIVTVSNGVAEDLLRHVRLVPERVVTIYNPVVDEQLIAKSQAPPAHPWLLSLTIPVVVAVGRLNEQKDFATLIHAFARLRRERPLRLIILGDGELRESLLAQIAHLGVAEDVALPGFEANPFAALRAASVFVLSSRFEGLPNVLIQAMACGTRVVSTDCPSGPREILEDGRWGALVPVGDPDAIAAAISAALDNPRPPDVQLRAAAFSEALAIDRYAQVLGLQAPSPHHA